MQGNLFKRGFDDCAFEKSTESSSFVRSVVQLSILSNLGQEACGYEHHKHPVWCFLVIDTAL